MATFSFTLILDGDAPTTEDMENALFEAGCEDALLGSRYGAVYLDFDREAETPEKAVSSALKDVARSGFKVRGVEPSDWVNASEIGRRLGRTRQSINQLITGERGPGGFPKPASGVKSSSPLWSWGEVALWAKDNALADTPEMQCAAAIMGANRKLLAQSLKK